MDITNAAYFYSRGIQDNNGGKFLNPVFGGEFLILPDDFRCAFLSLVEMKFAQQVIIL